MITFKDTSGSLLNETFCSDFNVSPKRQCSSSNFLRSLLALPRLLIFWQGRPYLLPRPRIHAAKTAPPHTISLSNVRPVPIQRADVAGLLQPAHRAVSVFNLPTPRWPIFSPTIIFGPRLQDALVTFPRVELLDQLSNSVSSPTPRAQPALVPRSSKPEVSARNVFGESTLTSPIFTTPSTFRDVNCSKAILQI